MRDVPDMDLLQEFLRTQSEEAFATVVQRHINLVHSVALRHTANAHDAQEITQAVFIILARKAESLSPNTVLSGWLYQTARLTAANFQRSEWRRTRREQEAYMQSTLEAAPDDAAWRELSPRLDEAMSHLGSTDRDALVLRYFENKSLEQVGQALGVEERAAQKRVSRALDKLRNLFAKRGVALSAAVIAGVLSANSVQSAPAGLAATISATALKGSAVAGSMTTLVNETIKVMTWLKIKFAAGVAGIVLFTGGALTVASVAVTDSKTPDIQGAWEGVMETPGVAIVKGEINHTRLVLKVGKTNGTYWASADGIDAGRQDIPMDKVTYNYPNLRLESARFFLLTGSKFVEGTVNPEGTELTFHDDKGPTVLKRTHKPTPPLRKLAENEFMPRDNSDLQGYWKGAIGTMPLFFKIAEETNGNFRAELDNPMQGAMGQPVSVVYNPPAVDLIVRTGSGMFHGTLNKNKTLLKGAWIQGNGFTPASFKLDIYQPESPLEAGKTYAFTSPNELQGHWKGVLKMDQIQFRLTLDIAKLADGTYSADLAAPEGPGNNDPAPATSFQFNPPDVVGQWNWMGGQFKGKLEDGKLSGTVKIAALGNTTLPITFERSTAK